MNSVLNKLKSLLIKSLYKGLKSLIKNDDEIKDLLENINKKGKKKDGAGGEWENLPLIANKMVENARNGILVNLNGKIVKDFNFDMQRMQKVFDGIEQKRINKKKEGLIKYIRISANDIKAVLFKPIIKLPLENENLLLRGSRFKQLWEFVNISLNEEIENLTQDKINMAFEFTKDNINSFERFVLSKLKDDDYSEFIKLMLDEVPTAFGQQSL